MRGFLAACGLAAVACGFGACGGSAFTVGPGDDGGTGEAGSSSGALADGPVSESGSSSGSGSGSGSSSGSGSGGDASPGHWCDGQKTFFCEDFDRQTDVNTFLASWTNFEQSNGGFHFDQNSVPSPPNALRVTGGNSAVVLAVKTFPALPTRPTSVRLEFALRIDSAGNVGLASAAGFAAIAYGTSIKDGFAAMAIGHGPVIAAAWVAPADAGVGDAGPFNTANAAGAFPPAQTWAGRYAIEIDYHSGAADSACAQIFQGPTPLLPTCMPLPPSLSDPKVLSVAIGDDAAGFGVTGPIDLAFDDLTFDVVY